MIPVSAAARDRPGNMDVEVRYRLVCVYPVVLPDTDAGTHLYLVNHPSCGLNEVELTRFRGHLVAADMVMPQGFLRSVPRTLRG